MTEVVMSQTPPVLHGPTEKERKYDRQLRLWAATGQAALESAHIVLFNSGSGTVGVETLKNLVLPGIGSFTIIDEAVVTQEDLGVNFFLDAGSLGKSRAASATDFLLELNPEVRGEWHPKQREPIDVERLLETLPAITIILHTYPIDEKSLDLLRKFGNKHMTPVFSVHSAGFYSYFHVQLPGSFPIVETHPDETATMDLRLLSPWPELAEFAKEMTQSIDDLDDHEHGHLPYVVIVLHFLEVWKKENNGQYPLKFSEKNALRKMIERGARKGVPGGEENFEEAASLVRRIVTQQRLPDSVREVFDHVPSGPAETHSSFWTIAGAVKKFYDRHGCLPVSGSLPDMKAQSGVYVKLQSIYKNKARRDAEEVLGLAQELAGEQEIDPTEVDIFCKNAAFVKLIHKVDDDDPGRLSKITAKILSDDKAAEENKMPQSLVPIYLALRATSHVSEASPGEILTDVSRVIPRAEENERLVAAAREVSRAKGGELHNTSAVTGGIVAQEMIKIITKQYVPIDNTCIFDGIGSRCQVLRL